MSNARSPREVCSTTIGTSGLTVLASFRFSRSNPSTGRRPRGRPLSDGLNRSLAASLATQTGRPNRPDGSARRSGPGRPELPAGPRRLALATGRPELVAGLRLLDGDRRRGLGDEVERLALREVLLERVEPAGRLQALEQLLGRAVL